MNVLDVFELGVQDYAWKMLTAIVSSFRSQITSLLLLSAVLEVR